MTEVNKHILIPETLDSESQASYSRQIELCSKINEKDLIEALEDKIIPHMSATTIKEIQIPESTHNVCRICLQSDLEESNKCISPCFCRGSISKVHRKCVEKWLLQANSSDCEICTYKYKTRWITKYSLLGSIKGWIFSKKNKKEIKELFRDLWILLIIVMLLLSLSCFKVYITKHLIVNRDIQTTVIGHNHHLLSNVSSIQYLVKYYSFYQVALFSTSATIATLDFCLGFISSFRIHHHITNWYNFYKNTKKVIILDLNLPQDSVNSCTG